MNPSAKVKVCTPHGTGWATEVSDDDFVWVEFEDHAVWIHAEEVQIDRQQFSGSRTGPIVCSLIGTIFAALLGYWLY